MEDFARCIPVSIENLRILIKVAALHLFGEGKKEQIFTMTDLGDLGWPRREPKTLARVIFEVDSMVDEPLPELPNTALEDAYD